MSDKLEIHPDSVLGLGRVALNFNFKTAGQSNVTLPFLHFILYRDTDVKGEDTITALCLEFALFYSNPDQNKAFFGLRHICGNLFGKKYIK